MAASADGGGANHYSSARLKLARLVVSESTPLGEVVRRVVKLSAHAVGVERVGLWIFERGATELVCVEMLVRSTGKHTRGERLRTARFPVYVRTLEEHRAIVVDDARESPLTRELGEDYLIPNGITSMLDAPVFRGGDVVGVLCHEHVGEPRSWTKDQIAFASSAADIVAGMFEQSARLEAERELRSQQVEIERARKLEALALFATQVVHDLNNILTVVRSAIDVLAARGVEAELGPVSDAVSHGARLVKQLLAFARPAAEEPRVATVRIADAVADSIPLVRAAVGTAFDVRTEIERGPWRVRLEATDVERLMLNLALNARDAMPAGGEIFVSLGLEETPPGAAPSVLLEVRDEGIGMDAATQARIFDPFFTTKGVGTGLGLSTVHGIVRRAGGTIDVTSAPGKGATLDLRLPVAEER